MPGLCGAISLDGSAERSRLDALVSSMLAAMHREEFCATKRWSCPGGRAQFAGLGLPGLIASWPTGVLPVEGLVYGRISAPTSSEGDWLTRIKGSYSLAVHDAHTGAYFVATDRKSSEPVFYTKIGGVLCFAPEIRALLSLPGVSRAADFGALASLVVSGHLHGNATLFRDVRRLEGGHALRIEERNCQSVEYWRFTPGISGAVGQEQLLADLDSVLARSIGEEITHPERKTAVFLSGGCDSRVILGYARDHRPLHTVSWGLRESREGSDADIADRLAKMCRTEHRLLERGLSDFGTIFEEANAVTEAQSDVAAFHPQEFRLMRRLKESGFDRVVRGDETFGWKKMVFSRLGAFATVGLRRFGGVRGLSGFFRAEAAETLSEAHRRVTDDLQLRFSGFSANQMKDALYFTQRLQHYLNSCACSKRILFEHSNPLLADEVLDLLSLVPDESRVDKKLLRLLLARRFPDLQAVGFASDDGLEDWSLLWREESALRAYISRQLADSESAVWELYDANALGRVFAARTESTPYSPGGVLERSLTRGLRDVSKCFSRSSADHLQARLFSRAPMNNSKLLLRFLVVKNWIDRYKPTLK